MVVSYSTVWRQRWLMSWPNKKGRLELVYDKKIIVKSNINEWYLHLNNHSNDHWVSPDVLRIYYPEGLRYRLIVFLWCHSNSWTITSGSLPKEYLRTTNWTIYCWLGWQGNINTYLQRMKGDRVHSVWLWLIRLSINHLSSIGLATITYQPRSTNMRVSHRLSVTLGVFCIGNVCGEHCVHVGELSHATVHSDM